MAMGGGGGGPAKKPKKSGKSRWAYFEVKKHGGINPQYTQWLAHGQRGAAPPKYTTTAGSFKGWVRVGSRRWNHLRGQAVPKRYAMAHYNPASKAYIRAHATMKTGETVTHSGTGITSNPARKSRSQIHKAYGGGGGGGGNKPRNKPKNHQRQNFNFVGGKVGNPKVGTMLKRGYADDLAGMQFDPAINDLKTAMARLGPQQAQQLHDIDQWYGQVQSMNTQARGQNQAMANSVGNAADASTQAVLAALGGGANPGAGMVGAAGNDAAASARMLGATQDQYQANLAPLLANQQAGQKSAQMALMNQNAQDLQLQLADLMGQRGQAKTAAIMDIVNQNNALAQQRFANRISKLQAQSGVSELMGNLALQQEQIRSSRAQKPAGNPNSWVNLDPASKVHALRYAMQRTGTPDFLKQHGPRRSYSQALRVLQSLGYSGAKAAAALRAYY